MLLAWVNLQMFQSTMKGGGAFWHKKLLPNDKGVLKNINNQQTLSTINDKVM